VVQLVKETKKQFGQRTLQKKVNDTDWILEHAFIVDWKKIARTCYMTNDALIRCKQYIQWDKLCRYQQLDKELIIEFKKKMFLHNIFRFQKNITIDLLEDLSTIAKDYDWHYFEKHKLPISIIKEKYLVLDLEKLTTTHLSEKEKEVFDSLVVMKKLQS
jgi:hypothetical protein